MQVLKFLFFLFLCVVSVSAKQVDLANIAVTPKMAVLYAADAYLQPNDFKIKYKKKDNKVGSALYNGVRLYAIEESEYIVFIFRGTATIKNTKTDMNAGASTFLGIKGTKVHKGFYNIAVNSKKIFKNLIAKNKPIFIVGHSLGGAISVLLGAMLNKENTSEVVVYTFGSPPVGNQKFIETIEGLKHYRYVHKHDPIAKINEEFAKKLNKSLTKIENKLIGKVKYKALLINIQSLKLLFLNLDYDYIHDDYQMILLDGKIVPSNKLKKYPLWVKFLFTPFNAHTIDTYKLNIL